jgi:hypothetical protein
LENFLEWKSGNGPLLSLTSKLELNSASAEWSRWRAYCFHHRIYYCRVADMLEDFFCRLLKERKYLST